MLAVAKRLLSPAWRCLARSARRAPRAGCRCAGSWAGRRDHLQITADVTTPQSPFTGKYEALDTGQPLLYARCTRLEDLTQAAAAPAAVQALADTPGQPSARKKRRLDKAVPAGLKPPAAGKAEQQAAKRPEDYNNKAQALGIRSVLGARSPVQPTSGLEQQALLLGLQAGCVQAARTPPHSRRHRRTATLDPQPPSPTALPLALQSSQASRQMQVLPTPMRSRPALSAPPLAPDRMQICSGAWLNLDGASS